MALALDELAAQAHTCTRCVLSEGRTNVVFGMGDPEADLFFVGEGPGAEEDEVGLPFVGRSGQLLDRLLEEELGLDRSSCYIANVVKCRPPENRDPKRDEIAACRPYLEEQIELIAPAVIITLGNFASKLLLNTKTGITKLRGSSYRYGASVVVPTFHPAAALRGGVNPLAKMRTDFTTARRVMAGEVPELATVDVVSGSA